VLTGHYPSQDAQSRPIGVIPADNRYAFRTVGLPICES
jgi:hypothetical protein